MPEQFNPTHEERWIAALCHTSGLTIFFGLLVSLIVFLTQKSRSPFLKIQSLQALIYQGAALVIYWVISIGLMLAYFGTFFPLVIFSSTGSMENPFFAGLFFLVFGLIMLFSLFFSLILAPAYGILALVAAWRSGKGDDFRYPVIGAFVER